MKKLNPLPDWVTGLVIAGTFGGLLVSELLRPLRKSVEPKLRRDARNLTIAGIGALAVAVSEQPVARRLSAFAAERHWGLLRYTRLPLWLETAAAVLLMDYTLYWWHVATHRVPLLWRFHAVHHADLDMDASTGLRFHVGELVLSLPWRASQIALIGVSPLALSLWQTLLYVSILFHHSNLRLAPRAERWLNLLIVTPRMHGIHHSMKKTESDTNWSSGLSIWDRLHGTILLDVPQDRIRIGVASYPEPDDVTLPRTLVMPFLPQPD